jgi:hypothetical protein
METYLSFSGRNETNRFPKAMPAFTGLNIWGGVYGKTVRLSN